MKRSLILHLALAGLAGLAACAKVDPEVESNPHNLTAEIRYTSFGVPHVKADNFASLGYGVAQAYLRENFCLMAEQVMTVNGERSKYLGPTGTAIVGLQPITNRESDFFFKAFFDKQKLAAAFLTENPADALELIGGYIEGYNDFLAKTGAAALPEPCRNQPWVRAIGPDDIALMVAEKATLLTGGGYARSMFNAQPPAGGVAAAPVNEARVRPAKYDKQVLLAQLHPASVLPAASNAYAIGKDATPNGAGMMLANPHFPWAGTTRFFQVHMTVPGKFDVFGGMWGDFPIPLIGFNADIAWTHTVSAALRHTAVELTLVPGKPTRYIVDGAEREMERKEIAIQVKDAAGGLATETRNFYSTIYGPVASIVSPAPGGANLTWSGTTAYALRDANLGNTRLMRQWFRIGRAKSAQEVKQALDDVAGVPWVNTLVADRDGNALYADIGVVPNITADKFKAGAQGGCVKGAVAQGVLRVSGIPILDGSKSACDWETVAGAAQPGALPTAKMPSVMRTDYVANSNNSAWLSNPAARIDDLAPVMGPVKAELTLRQRLAFMQIESRLAGTDGLSPNPRFDNIDTLRKILYQNRLLGAELSVDAMVGACAELGTPANVTIPGGTAGNIAVNIAPACSILAAWDKRANLDSVGAALFREFWRTARTMPNLWRVPFDANDPIHTPRDLNTADAAVKAKLLETLAATVAKFQALNIDIAKPLRDVQGTTIGGKRIALPGGDEFEGTFNKITMFAPVAGAGYVAVAEGSSIIQAVTWINGQVVAEGILAYSQSTDPKSAHASDQTELYAQSKFTKLRFTDSDIAADPNFRTEVVQLRKP